LSDEHETFSSEMANLYFDDASADFAALHATIATLTPDQRLTINLLKLKEMSLKETALASGRLRKRLRQTSQTR
jgi:DNA-directed RNA polymerase specialized sigma24 family protein